MWRLPAILGITIPGAAGEPVPTQKPAQQQRQGRGFYYEDDGIMYPI